MSTIDSQLIDGAFAAAFAATHDGQINISNVMNHLQVIPDNRQVVEARVERELHNSDELFYDEKRNDFILREFYFTGKTFCITPDDLEIDEGILFPGHRFCAFAHNDIFPSEVSLLSQKTGKEVDVRLYTIDVTTAIPYHLLLGTEQIFDFFIAEHPQNIGLKDATSPSRKISLTVFDLKEFYDQHQFSSGDALLVKVKNWREGTFSFSYLSGTMRRETNVKKWVDAFADAIEIVIDKFDSYLEIPEQLRQALFVGNNKILFGKDAASLDEFYQNNDRIEINCENPEHTLLARKLAPESSDQPEVPEQLSISNGCTASFKEILQELGSPLTPTEIDAYILEQYGSDTPEFNGFFRRCFAGESLMFADDAQEAVFLNLLEDRWEELTLNYHIEIDGDKASLRSRILELIDQRVDWLERLKSINPDPAALPKEKMKRLAEISLYMNEILEFINMVERSISQRDREEIQETIEQLADAQNELLEDTD